MNGEACRGDGELELLFIHAGLPVMVPVETTEEEAAIVKKDVRCEGLEKGFRQQKGN